MVGECCMSLLELFHKVVLALYARRHHVVVSRKNALGKSLMHV